MRLGSRQPNSVTVRNAQRQRVMYEYALPAVLVEVHPPSVVLVVGHDEGCVLWPQGEHVRPRQAGLASQSSVSNSMISVARSALLSPRETTSALRVPGPIAAKCYRAHRVPRSTKLPQVETASPDLGVHLEQGRHLRVSEDAS